MRCQPFGFYVVEQLLRLAWRQGKRMGNLFGSRHPASQQRAISALLQLIDAKRLQGALASGRWAQLSRRTQTACGLGLAAVQTSPAGGLLRFATLARIDPGRQHRTCQISLFTGDLQAGIWIRAESEPLLPSAETIFQTPQPAATGGDLDIQTASVKELFCLAFRLRFENRFVRKWHGDSMGATLGYRNGAPIVPPHQAMARATPRVQAGLGNRPQVACAWPAVPRPGDTCGPDHSPDRGRIRSRMQAYGMILFVGKTRMHAKMIRQVRTSANCVGIRSICWYSKGM